MNSRPRQQALALAAMLAATAVTAIAAVGGLTRWSSARPPSTPVPVTSVVPQQAAPPAAGEGDD